jgi:hypothetical protein
MVQRCPIHAFHDTYLKALDAGSGSVSTSRIQKGLVLEVEDRDLSEEGVGFGLPVLKLGLQPLFPGSWSMSAKEENGLCLIEADFEMNLRARVALQGKIINNGLFCSAWETFCKIHRDYPRLRGLMSLSSRNLKKKLDLKDVFSEELTLGFVRASYVVSGSSIDVELRFPRISDCTELIVLNEQGANWFDTYQDSNGLILTGERIGSWDQIEATHASFVDTVDGIMFTLKRAEGAKMYRGREFADGSLAWSGLAYVLPPWTEKFTYSIELGRI